MNVRTASLIVLLALCASCASKRQRPSARDLENAYPGELRPAGALGFDVVWRQSVDVAWPEGSEGFDAAVQVQGDTLLVLALSPIGQPGFVLRLKGSEIAVENPGGVELPIPARFVLLDVQRTFFPWFADRPAFADGERAAEVSGETVRERWSGGRLAERRFARLDGVPSGEIRITYEWGDTGRDAPAHAVLVNGWCGYQLDVRTHEETRLPSDRGP